MTAPSTTAERIGVLGVVFGAGVAVVVVHLWWLMVAQQPVWAARSHENRWAFRTVPSQRGAMLDRHGRLLVCDEPTMELGVYYDRFRLFHPVGAAVHGASLWAHVRSGLDDPIGLDHDYGDGERGAMQAAEELLAMPTAALRPRVLPKDVQGRLGFAATTVLSVCSGESRERVFGALRQAAAVRDGACVGDVLATPRATLLANFAERLAALRRLDRDASALQAARRGTAGAIDASTDAASPAEGLLATLERVRLDVFARERAKRNEDVDAASHESAGATEADGLKLQELVLPFATELPFDFAADVRVAGDVFTGVTVQPSAARHVAVPEDSMLRVLLGRVVDFDRSVPATQGTREQQEAARRQWLARHVDRGLPTGWLDDVQRLEIDDAPSDDDKLAEKARVSYVAGLLEHERRGVSGLEAVFDATLRGRQGLRLVERDRARREQRLWSHLRVDAGDDVRLTFDLDLQLAAERIVQRTRADIAGRYSDARDFGRVKAALAVIDARTGDVLALAGAPVVSDGDDPLPGVGWTSNGSIGSVAKPFLLVEQLVAERDGRPHRPLAEFTDCDDHFAYAGTVLRCGHKHWGVGRDPLEAVAESCNEFFYQVGSGLGRDGVVRALRRFGLARPADAADPFAACWLGRIDGVPLSAPALDLGQLDARMAIGYGVQATPLHVARAYAAFATGSLPTLGVVPGARPRVALNDVVGDLAFVEEGLRRCVTHGTAEKVPVLAELGVLGKTGTAEVGTRTGKQNNAWFAGYLPFTGSGGVQLCFCSVVYWVPDGVHGAECAGGVVADLLTALRGDAELRARYLVPEGGR
ncbi:MAG: hypothetical protein JNK15_09265 [Planctomycetes bacterium]|nr:hypothetical protein [Planctomycetota bacterium]